MQFGEVGFQLVEGMVSKQSQEHSNISSKSFFLYWIICTKEDAKHFLLFSWNTKPATLPEACGDSNHTQHAGEHIKENVLENNITAHTERQLHLDSPPLHRWPCPAVTALDSSCDTPEQELNKQVANHGPEPSAISVSRTSILKWPLYKGPMGQCIP